MTVIMMKENNNVYALTEAVSFLSKRAALTTLALGTGLFFSLSANAATPAGTLIKNTAHATYANATGVPQTPVDSNEVVTTVSPVGEYTLTSSQSYNVSPGETRFLLHTVTNLGNTADAFQISVPLAVPTSLTTVQVFRDDNNDGIHQAGETTILCTVTGANTCTFNTPTIAENGGVYNFFVQMVVSPTATVGSVATANIVAVPATPALYTTTSLTNTDTLTVSATVFSVQKSITTATSGTWNSTAGQTVTYKLAYQNTGTAAGPLYLEDTIGVAGTISDTTGFTYKPATGNWNNGTTTVAVTDAANGDPAGVHYEVTGTPGTNPNTIKVYVENVAAGASGYITFDVRVKDATIVGTNQTNNVGYFGVPTNCTTGSCTTPTPPTSTSPTGNTPFEVLISGAFILEKYQATSAWAGSDCGTAPAATSYVKTGISQTPGNCIWYKVVATNGSTADVTNVKINDTTPTNTTYGGGAACTKEGTVTGTPALTNPTIGQTGTVDCSAWTTVPAGTWTQLEFAVRINP